MADQADVRRIVLSLPETAEDPRSFRFTVRGKPICWAWMQRIAPGQPRIPRDDVVALRVADDLEKRALLALEAEGFFTEPHYDGYPAVLVRLPQVPLDLLEQALTDAWRVQATAALRRDFDARG